MRTRLTTLAAALLCSACGTDPAVTQAMLQAHVVSQAQPTLSIRCPSGGCEVTYTDPRDRQQLAESPVSGARVLTLFRPHAGPLTIVVIAVVAASVVGLAQPFLLRLIIDDALPNRDTTLLAWAVGAMIGVAALTGVLGVVQTWLATTMGQRVMCRLRADVFSHVQSQSMAFFSTPGTE